MFKKHFFIKHLWTNASDGCFSSLLKFGGFIYFAAPLLKKQLGGRINTNSCYLLNTTEKQKGVKGFQHF